MGYKIEFSCGIRRYHVYKTKWISVLNENRNFKKDNCEEALIYDKHSVGVMKKIGTLVGHIPIEPSLLTDYFMKEKNENFLSALLVGPRTLQVVPVKFTAFTKELRVATILSAEILKIKAKYTHFELSFVESEMVKQPMLKEPNVF